MWMTHFPRQMLRIELKRMIAQKRVYEYVLNLRIHSANDGKEKFIKAFYLKIEGKCVTPDTP